MQPMTGSPGHEPADLDARAASHTAAEIARRRGAWDPRNPLPAGETDRVVYGVTIRPLG
jgi:hypothetical protein